MKRIFLTVDVECHDYERQNEYLWGKTTEGVYGIEAILKVAANKNIPINFFVEIGESIRYGKKICQDICDLIRKYNQPIYMHLHPNFISEDDSRTYFWQYNYEEKKKILKEAASIFYDITGEKCKGFRIGRYAADKEMYSVLDELKITPIDLSYKFSFKHKMCKMTAEEYGGMNNVRRINNIITVPNTVFIGFSLLGIKRVLNFDIQEARLYELKKYIDETKLNNLVCTMHSWSLIKKFFWRKGYVAEEKQVKRRMEKFIDYAKDNGWTFSKINFEDISYDETDELLDFTKGIKGKITSLYCNFIRFYYISRLTAKYLYIYMLFFVLMILIIVLGGYSLLK